MKEYQATFEMSAVLPLIAFFLAFLAARAKTMSVCAEIYE
jgi:hypothetical protein